MTTDCASALQRRSSHSLAINSMDDKCARAGTLRELPVHRTVWRSESQLLSCGATRWKMIRGGDAENAGLENAGPNFHG